MTDRNSKAKRTQKAIEARRLTQEEFIRRCVEKHGDAYDYRYVEFVNTSTRATIVCNKCKRKSEQLPSNHMRGARCKYCYGSIRFTKKKFVDVSSDKHKGFYSYEKIDYKNNHTEVIITCPIHGDFKQKPVVHLMGSGCQDCAMNVRREKLSLTFDEFARRSEIAHQHRYIYDKDLFYGLNDKAGITCKKHGLFYQDAKAHMHGKGCRQCGFESSGFDRSRFKRVCKKNNDGRGLFYAIKCKLGKESFYKIGITSRSVEERYCSKGHLPYSYTTLYSIEDNADYIHKLEARVHALLKEHHYTPQLEFKGSVYECFTTIKPVEKLLKELSTTEQLQLLA